MVMRSFPLSFFCLFVGTLVLFFRSFARWFFRKESVNISVNGKLLGVVFRVKGLTVNRTHPRGGYVSFLLNVESCPRFYRFLLLSL